MIEPDFQTALWERQGARRWAPDDYLLALAAEAGRLAGGILVGDDAQAALEAAGAAAVHLIGYCSARQVAFAPLLRGPAPAPVFLADRVGPTIQNLEVVQLCKEVGYLCRRSLSRGEVAGAARAVAHTLRAIAARRGVEFSLLLRMSATRTVPA